MLVGIYIYGITTLKTNSTISSGVETLCIYGYDSIPGYIYISNTRPDEHENVHCSIVRVKNLESVKGKHTNG